jgi:CRISPR/Cas system-associated exonuclease Cas4 (RecB family)
MTLSNLWDAYKAQQSGDSQLLVEFRGEKDRAKGIHASELSGCQRKLTYGAMGVERRIKAEDKNVWMQRVFNIGTIVHAYIQDEMHKMCEWLNQGGKQLTFEDEAPIHPGLGGVAQAYNLHSSCDGVFTFWYHVGQGVYAPYMRVGLEIKTASEKQYESLSKPKDDHAEQTCLYMAALDVPLMWVLYMNKSNQMVSRSEPPFLFKFNAALWQTLEKRIVTVLGYAQNGQLPAKQEGKHCGWCPFAHTCKPNCLNAKDRVSYSPPTGREF